MGNNSGRLTLSKSKINGMYLSFIVILFLASLFLYSCAKKSDSAGTEKENMNSMNAFGIEQDAEFRKMCGDSGYEWMLMKPTKDGEIMKDSNECWGCMVAGVEHVCDRQKFLEMTN